MKLPGNPGCEVTAVFTNHCVADFTECAYICCSLVPLLELTDAF